MQSVLGIFGDDVRELLLPEDRAEVMPGVRWGRYDQFFSPAYWVAQMWLAEAEPLTLNYKLGSTLKEEVAVCLLGGHGIKGEVCFAAFQALSQAGLLDAKRVTECKIAEVLKKPLIVNNRSIRYRFPNNRASYLAPVLNRLSKDAPSADCHSKFREWFLQFRGIGPKTASWITRNWLDSKEVAILDIHIIRSGMLCGLFNNKDNVSKNYFDMEKRYLTFASRLGVDAAKLDVLIWQQMRQSGVLNSEMRQDYLMAA